MLASARPLVNKQFQAHDTMDLPVNESLTLADKIVLDNLRSNKPSPLQDEKTVSLLDEQNNPSSTDFLPTVFTIFPEPPALNGAWKAYTACASRIVRRPTDIGVYSMVLAGFLLRQIANEASCIFLDPIGPYLCCNQSS